MTTSAVSMWRGGTLMGPDPSGEMLDPSGEMLQAVFPTTETQQSPTGHSYVTLLQQTARTMGTFFGMKGQAGPEEREGTAEGQSRGLCLRHFECRLGYTVAEVSNNNPEQTSPDEGRR
ncbi:unnamed protein product [Pleuronectes platessa]|uniref:Uncharacterized protein n=1 Tax=Pleuronectes platessa TaxID=8262 RepID=A0A9N7V6S6_PLEPL|nr:unnamed protein product [Pleuronectes platessa]